MGKINYLGSIQKYLLLPIKNANISKPLPVVCLRVFSAKIRRKTFETLKVSIVLRSIFFDCKLLIISELCIL